MLYWGCLIKMKTNEHTLFKVVFPKGTAGLGGLAKKVTAGGRGSLLGPLKPAPLPGKGPKPLPLPNMPGPGGNLLG